MLKMGYIGNNEWGFKIVFYATFAQKRFLHLFVNISKSGPQVISIVNFSKCKTHHFVISKYLLENLPTFICFKMSCRKSTRTRKSRKNAEFRQNQIPQNAPAFAAIFTIEQSSCQQLLTCTMYILRVHETCLNRLYKCAWTK